MSGNGRHTMYMCVERRYVVANVCDAYIYTTVGIYISFLVMTATLRPLPDICIVLVDMMIFEIPCCMY